MKGRFEDDRAPPVAIHIIIGLAEQEYTETSGNLAVSSTALAMPTSALARACISRKSTAASGLPLPQCFWLAILLHARIGELAAEQNWPSASLEDNVSKREECRRYDTRPKASPMNNVVYNRVPKVSKPYYLILP